MLFKFKKQASVLKSFPLKHVLKGIKIKFIYSYFSLSKVRMTLIIITINEIPLKTNKEKLVKKKVLQQ